MIAELVQGLPELYQPIYRHPELSGAPSRPCEDRLGPIADAHDVLARLLGRPLKVLDLGCAQGFFSLQLAERGANVHGVDFLDKNIEVCTALAAEHPQLTVSFETGRVEDVIGRLTADQYDLVLGLSVFHHIVHEKGAGEVAALLERVGRDCGAMLVELALHDEPLYWGGSQPQDPRSLLASVAFVHELGWHETHLSSIARPLYVASNRYWLFGERAGRFDSWTEEPHALAHGTHEGSRRYFFSPDQIAKIYRFDHVRGEHNKTEFSRESRFLTEPPRGVRVPTCFVCGADETHGWVVAERWPGHLLLDALQQGIPIEDQRIVIDVLEQLAALESAGLYHNDVRAWNVLLAADGSARLIDFGSISEVAADCVWPQDIFLAFFIFVHEVATGLIEDPDPLRTVALSPQRLPQPYRAWAAQFWRRPRHEWSFRQMHDTLIAFLERGEPAQGQPAATAMDRWMSAIEQAIDLQRQFGRQMVGQLQAERQRSGQKLEALRHVHERESALFSTCVTKADSLAAQAEQRSAEAQRDRLHAEQRRADAERASERAEQRAAAAEQGREQAEQRAVAAELEKQRAAIHTHHLQRQIDGLRAELEALRASWSWQVTAPLRWGAALVLDRESDAAGKGSTGTNGMTARLQRLMVMAMRKVLHRPALAYRINQQLLKYPQLHQRLVAMARREGMAPGVPPDSAHAAAVHLQDADENSGLSRHERTLHARLKAAIDRRQGGER